MTELKLRKYISTSGVCTSAKDIIAYIYSMHAEQEAASPYAFPYAFVKEVITQPLPRTVAQLCCSWSTK